jgi:hypothetical protein
MSASEMEKGIALAAVYGCLGRLVRNVNVVMG